MISHMYNIILKAKQGSMTGPDLCSENYLYRSKLRKGKSVELKGKSSNWTGQKGDKFRRPIILNFLT